jgi:polyisoprenyl-teichoic acid--peptidoglycan teichoic acid transferase
VNISLIKTLLSLDSLKKYNNQINILLLGIAGGDNDGPNLTDSIIFVNYNLLTNTATTISIPRDIWSTTLQDKINSAYAYGEAKEKNGGLKLARAEVEGIVGLPIHYAAVIDFSRFQEIVDFFHGIDVIVSNSFIDSEFPINGRENDLCNGDPEYKCRYETIAFTKGLTNMNGETALKYVRSRHAIGQEGNDFSREKRQQEIISAIYQSVINLVKSGNITKLKQFYQLINASIKRDITNQQAAILIKNIVFHGKFHKQNVILEEDFLTNPTVSNQYDGKWVLIPENNDFSKIQSYISCKLIHIQNSCF